MQKKAIIIGAGIGGLTSALKLARAGLQVNVFEANSQPGGKISELRAGKFRFDTGPSLFTLPEVIDELLNSETTGMQERFEYIKLETVFRYFFPDGSIINSCTDPKAFGKEVNRITGISKSIINKYLSKASRMYDLTKDLFIFNEFKFPSFLLRKEVYIGLANWRTLEPFKTMHQLNLHNFEDPRLVQLFDRFATYNGSNPFKAPGTLALITHLEHNIGAYFPKKGMYDIIKTLYKSALDAGVIFHFNSTISAIHTKYSRVTGVSIEGGSSQHEADYYISNSDIVNTYQYLGNVKARKKYMSQERSTSAIIFYWGIKGNYPQLELHNILFSDNNKEEFDCLYEKKIVYSDPTVYIFISSKIVKEDAPEGHENWFVLINTPENVGQDWDRIIYKARENIFAKIKKTIGLDIAPNICYEKIADPRTIESASFAWRGSLYGSNSNSKFAAFNRHPNTSRKYKNLYFAGGTVHPGGGIPLCVSSANIVSNKILKKP